MIKAIIFDFDDTMYVGDVWEGYIEFEKMLAIKAIGDEGKYNEIVKRNNFTHAKSLKCIADLFRKEKLNLRKLRRTYNQNIFVHSSKDVKTLPTAFFEKLRGKFDIYFATMSQKNYIKHYTKLYGFNLKLFKGVEYFNIVKDTSKEDSYMRILKKSKLKPEEILMIGNSYDDDIVPAQNMGLQTLHFGGDFNQIYGYIEENGMLDCGEFKTLSK
ncbi:MAG: HAD family hydrolase [Clostridia bacterium]|nr:HAD family hydrolase [Clostridia bacterium]